MSAGRRPRLGTLFWLSVLLIGSAGVRLGTDAGPAIAREAAKLRETELATAPGRPEKTARAEPRGGDEPAELAPLLRALQAREASAARRERQIEDRMKALDIAERAIDAKLAALREAEASLSRTLAQADGASEKDLTRLTSVYEKMKPKEAAGLFEAMDPAFAAGFLGRMKAEAAAGIMARLSPQAAYSISAILAGRNAAVPKN